MHAGSPRSPLLFASLVLGLASACSRTSPDTKYPPPGPSGGLPVLPMSLAEQGEEGDDDDDAAPATHADSPAPTAPAATAIDAALPGTPAVSLERSAACTDKMCVLKTWLPDPGLATETARAAVWSQSIKKGSMLVIPRHKDLVLLGVAPGDGLTLRADTGDATIVLAQATAKDSLGAALAESAKLPAMARWKTRPAKIAVADLGAAEDLSWTGGASHARIAFGSDASPVSSLEVLRMSANTAIPEHDHGPSEEHFAVLSGGGTLNLAGNAVSIKPGSVVHIPKDTKHAFSADGSGEVMAVQLYTPSGPEQRFKTLAGKAPPAPAASAPATAPVATPAAPPAAADKSKLKAPPAPKKAPPGTEKTH